MTVIYNCIDLLASFIELYILYKIYADLFAAVNVKDQGRKLLLFSILGVLLVKVCNHVAAFSYFTILLLVFYTSCTAYGLYRTNFLLCFSVASFYILCLSCFDFLIFTLISRLLNGYGTFIELVTQQSLMRTGVIILIKSLWIFAYRILRKKQAWIFSEKNVFRKLLGITIAGYVSFVYLVDGTFRAFENKISHTWFIFMLIFSLFIFMLMLSGEIEKERMKLNISELSNELLEEKYSLVSDIYSKNAKLYHDLNKHLNVLYQLLESGKTESAKNYIEKISEPMKQLSEKIWTGVDIIDIIINSELDKMNRYGIKADINVEFPQKTNLLPNDMCTILANLLDNSIEAIRRLENPEMISFTMRVVNQLLLIKVENRCTDQDTAFSYFPETTKKNKNLHGWGMRSVEEIVKKYNGKMQWKQENGTFEVMILMVFEKIK